MKFEKDPKTEELLNSYIDGELSPVEVAQVKRLVAGDKNIARRLRELERCRLLVSALPNIEPPAKVVSQIRNILHKQNTKEPVYAGLHRGHWHLLTRQVLAASLIVGLFGILSAVVYKIMAPTSLPTYVTVQPAPSLTPKVSPIATEKPVANAENTNVSLYTLKLATIDYVAVDAFINKLLDESPWLKYEAAKKQQPKQSTYRLLCSKGALEALVRDLSPAWNKFDSATLLVHTNDTGSFVAIENVLPGQVEDIVNQDSVDSRIKMAKDFDVLNNITRLSPDGAVQALANQAYPELAIIPKPVLTSGEKLTSPEPKGARDEVRVDLTIAVNSPK